MKTINVKAYNTKKITKELPVVTNDGQPTIIKAEKGINYEFFDQSIGRAPNHIITKRSGKDLHVSFERDGKETDLIIEGFYDNEDHALIGIAEDGQYYYYIPDTGEVSEYVTQLVEGKVEGQALGGEHLAAPWWVALPHGIGMPWWLGLGVLPVLFGGDDDSSTNTPEPQPIPSPTTAPVAKDDTQTATAVGVATTVAVVGNDADPENNIDPTTVVITQAPACSTIAADGKSVVVAGQGTWTVDPVTGSITFKPEASFKGDPAPISYTVKDSTGLVSNPATVTIDYPQDKPVATNDTIKPTTAGTPVTVDVLGNDTDPNNNIDPTSVQIVGSTDGKTLVVNGEGTWTVDPATGSITFKPEASFKGDPTPISYTVKDSTGLVSNPATVTIDYPQDKPVATNDTIKPTTAGTPVTVNVLTNDTDANNDIDPTSVQIVGSTDGKTLVVNGEGTWTVDPVTGNITFTPEASFKGDPAPISYTVKDSTGLVSNPATVTVDYPQDPPVATNDTAAPTTAGTPVTVNVLGNDTDANNDIDPTTVKLIDPATNTPATSVTIANQGTWSVDAVTGAVTFTPVAGFTGDPTPISYTVTDKTGLTSDPVSITLDYPQDKPTAVADTGTGATGQPVKVDVLANDSDVQNDIDPTTVKLIDPATNTPATSVTIANQGTWSVDAVTGAVTFTPVAGFTGDPTPISYTVTDKTGLTSDPVSITLDYPQDKPTAVADTGTGATGQPVKVDVLANDSDVQNDIDPTTVKLIDPATNTPATSVTIANQGTWSVDAVTGAVTFTPVSGFTGDPTPISYTVTDKTGLVSDPVSITLDYPQDKPAAVADTGTGATGQPVTVDVLANDSDAQNDIDPTTVKLIDPATNTPATSVTIANQGTWSVDAVTGAVTFTPVAGFTGDPTPISYTVTDKTGLTSDPVSITLDYPQDKPTAVADTGTGATGQPVKVDVLANDSDVQNDIDPTTVKLIDPATNTPATSVTIANQGTWSVDAVTGAVTFTPVAGFTGDPTPISYTVTDKTGLTSDPVSITLDYPQDKPTAVADTGTGATGQPVKVDVLANDSDVQNDIDPTTVKLIDPATNTPATSVTIANQGTWSVDAVTGAVTFTPVSGFTGDPTPISYTVTDKTGLTSDPVNITLDYPQDKPTAVADTGTGATGQPVKVDVLANDSDVQNDIDPTTVKLIDPATNTPATSVTIANQGTWSVDAVTGAVTFTPVAGFTGDPTPISYTVTDKTGLTSDPVSITLDYPQDKPTAVADTGTGATGQPVKVDVLANDSDVQNDIDPTTVKLIDPATNTPATSVTIANQGTWSVDAVTGAVTFTPVAGFTGDPTPISYTVTDKTGLTSDPVNITLDYPQDKPTAVADTGTGATGQPVKVDVLANDSDVQNDIDPTTVKLIDPATNTPATSVTIANQGTWSVDAVTGAVTFTPVAGFTGDPTPISYTVTDKTGLTSDPVNITLDYPQDKPTAVADTGTGATGQPVKVDVLANDSDVQNDIDPTTVKLIDPATNTPATSVTIANQGTWSVDAVTGAVTFTPVAGFTGDPTPISYTVTDKTGLTSDPATITLDYPQDKPAAVADTGRGETGQPVTVDVLANDSDVQNDIDPTTVKLIDPATNTPATSVTIANQGTWSVDAVTGAVTFTPVSGFTGDPTPISYTVTDKTGLVSDPATITLDYPQDKPAAVADTGTGATGQPVTVDVLANDSDVQNDIDPTTVKLIDPATNTPATSVTIANQGTWSVDAVTGAVTFTPVSGFTGDPTPISYTVTDKTGLVSDPATITLDYPQPPIANDDSAKVLAGGSVVATAIQGVLKNYSDSNITSSADTDPDVNDTLTVSAVRTGSESDTTGTSGSLGESLAGTYGHLILNADGSYQYVADNSASLTRGAQVTDVFTYTVSDGTYTDTAQLSINVTGANHVPVATDDTYSIAEDAATPLTLNPLNGDTDIDGDNLTITAINGTNLTPGVAQTIAVTNGTVNVAADGTITFSPAANYNGTVTIPYTISDGYGGTSTANEIINVTAPPDAIDDSNSISLGVTDTTSITGNVLTNDTDLDTAKANLKVTTFTVDLNGNGTTDANETFTFAGSTTEISNTVANVGTFVMQSNGDYTFTPVQSFSGNVPKITYTVSDGTSTDTANLLLRVDRGQAIKGVAAFGSPSSSGYGLNAEYYGYNNTADTYYRTISASPNFNPHTDDNTYGNLGSIATAVQLIDGRNGIPLIGTTNFAADGTPDVRFKSTSLNYRTNASLGTNEKLPAYSTTVPTAAGSKIADFLSHQLGGTSNGTNDASTIKVEAGLGATTDAAFRMTGMIYLKAGTYDFRVLADDGARLTLNNDINNSIKLDGLGGFTSSRTAVGSITLNSDGFVPLEFLYYDQGEGASGLRVEFKNYSDSTYQILDVHNLLMIDNRSIPTLSDIQDVAKDSDGIYKIRTGALLDGYDTNDSIIGTDGKDHLMGGKGDDTLAGGAGADKFIYSSQINNGHDVITDFTVGTDKIALSDVLSVNSATIDPVTKTWVPLDTTTVSLPSGITNVAWNDTSKTLSFDTTGGANNTIEFQGMTASYSDLNSFLQANAVI